MQESIDDSIILADISLDYETVHMYNAWFAENKKDYVLEEKVYIPKHELFDFDFADAEEVYKEVVLIDEKNYALEDSTCYLYQIA